ncbi:ion channel protein [Agromyces sp. CFH 90414]|uniref:Ion channel protein n=1 Tax=Agromyces agglutinans TaxID=2662258 RepID=A0A6I2F5W2_9MICO|nr:ion channel protein [Agromyces agglutinans]MRG59107.1 ion channel protein [Agromyces agglutinans]
MTAGDDLSGATPTPRQLLALSVPALLVGALTAVVLWLLDVVSESLGDLIWKAVPGSLGFDPDASWWILLVLTSTGVAVGLVTWLVPGHAGPDSATTDLLEPPLRPWVVPGLALAAVIGLAGGVSLGPENPIIAINATLVAFLFARLLPKVPVQLAVWLAAAGTIGALFGTPVAAALVFTSAMAGTPVRGHLWDRLFLPLAAAGAGSITMHLLGAPSFGFEVPAYPGPAALDLLTGSLIAVGTTVVGLAALAVFPWVHRAFHALRHPLLIPVAGGLVLGLLGVLGGPLTLFKGLEETGELLENSDEYAAGQLVVLALVKLVALVVAASSGFRGGRIFPAVFVGAALGLLGHALIPAAPLALAVACGVLGMVLVVGRDGWVALFVAVAVAGDVTLLAVLCVIILPAWLLVSRAPEFRIVEPEPFPSAAPGR